MGFSPMDVDLMTMAEFDACVEGWKRANGAEDKPPAPTDEEFDRILAQAGG